MPDTALLTGSIDIRQEVIIDAPRVAVFGALLDVGDWWPHRSDPEHDVMLEPAIGGHFAEAWDSGGELFGTVVEMEENALLAISGAMGLPEPTVGYFAYHLADAADGGGTTMTITHRAFGNFSAELAAEYDVGWTQTTTALRNHLSTHPGPK